MRSRAAGSGAPGSAGSGRGALPARKSSPTWVTDAHEQATATEDPWQALSGFFEQMLTTQAHNRAVVESYAARGGPTSSCAQRCYSFIDELRTRCMDAGLLRPDVTTDDLVLLSGSLSQAVLTAGESHPGQWRRLLRISLDGLSSRNTEPLPEPAVGEEQFLTVR
ncbi:hypothetical protein PV332_32830 [Streptomyces scabiei]|uniref:SbtR family transcriptional regulator n=1 Tax=Streptomyces TaxID=1883 RepID=UPI00030C4401|nr:hypothetical protein [Streptomyces scabiei]MDX2536165.1 hypothetical protein [Streptomyces scabiei]MDX2580231.1 hypothetical protein [Streptomyces scabiei]MDX2657948.1 hypothetical protein [Streptomyces scabiei]MDX2724588.1 hypothetical protein [Streptomyces scabiei]MDX2797368.1 hypothetical protein [Streptomyces scabiei]